VSPVDFFSRRPFASVKHAYQNGYRFVSFRRQIDAMSER